MDCPHIPELPYGDFSRSLYKKISGQRIPIGGSLELTFRCNLRCQHCYVSHGHDGILRQKELTYPEIQRIIDEVVDEGCLWFLLTGGEPLVRRDFPKIYSYAKRKGLLLSLFTNGTLLTPQIVDYLAEWRPFNIEISLYGHTQETYERVTGIPGSHARCRRGIELLLERGLPLRLKTVVMSINKHELEDMQAYAESLGVKFLADPMINAGLDNFKKPVSLRLSPEEIVQIERADPNLVELLPHHYKKRIGTQVNSRKRYICYAGQTNFHIDPYGNLCLCVLSREPSYNLRKGTFHEGWDSFLPKIYNQEVGDDFECVDCEYRSVCAQCPGNAQLEFGDPDRRSDFICQVTHLMVQEFINL